MAEDIIDIDILSDGTIRSENGKISAPNHAGASKFFELLGEIAGGKVERTRRKQGQVHVHNKVEEKEG